MAASIEEALARVPQWRDRTDLKVSFLAGGITNKNYRVDVGGRSFVVRLSGANTDLLGIDRAHERDATVAAASAGLAPQVVYFIEPEGYLVTRFIAGQPVTPDEMRRPDTIQQLARILQRIHALPPIPGSFSPFRVVEDYRRLADEHDVTGYPDDFDWLLERLQAIEAAFGRQPSFPVPCHNDLLNENFLREAAGGSFCVLDWEYAGMGDSYFDLANLAAQHRFGDEQDHQLLAAYFGEVTPRRLARLKLMKCMSDFREAMWGMLQIGISSLDFDFRGYAGNYFERLRAGFHDPRVAGWLSLLNQDD